MKTTLLLFLIATLSLSIQAQRANQISINNIEASITSNGSLFQDSASYGLFTINDANNTIAIHNASLWVAAYSGETSYTAAQQFYMAGNSFNNSTDYRFGPMADDYSQAGFQQKYNRVWKLSKQEIDLHKSNFNSSSYTMPADLAEWPAHGDSTNGEAAQLAPFEDLNGNSIYEPTLGEYPLIKGDQCLFVMFNESDRNKPLSDQSEIGLEFHLMAYAFDATTQPTLRNGLFFHYQIFNRSMRNYDSLQLAYWNDADLGAPFDDVLGSDSVLGMAYVYNGSPVDGISYGFGDFPPAIGARFLNKHASGSQYIINPGGLSNFDPAALTAPNSKPQFEHILNNRWLDGSKIRVENPSGIGSQQNGDGWDTAQSSMNPATKWAYNDQVNWYYPSLKSADIRQLLHHPSFALNAGDSYCIDLLVSYARDSVLTDPYSSVTKLKAEQNVMDQYFQTLNFNCGGSLVGIDAFSTQSSKLDFYPNPVRDVLNIDGLDSENVSTMEVADYSGRVIFKRELVNSSNKVDLRHLKPGIYILSLKRDNKALLAYKFYKL